MNGCINRPVQWPLLRRLRGAFLILVTSVATVPALGQDAELEEGFLDEIVITGEMTSNRLRFQIERAEADVYQIFNRLLDDSEYKVVCKEEANTASHIIRRSCEPAFLINARARNASHVLSAWRSGEDPALAMEMAIAGGLKSGSELKFEEAEKYEDMNQAMFDLAESDPELRRAILKVAALRNNVEVVAAREREAREQRKERGLFCNLFGRSCLDSEND